MHRVCSVLFGWSCEFKYSGKVRQTCIVASANWPKSQMGHAARPEQLVTYQTLHHLHQTPTVDRPANELHQMQSAAGGSAGRRRVRTCPFHRRSRRGFCQLPAAARSAPGLSAAQGGGLQAALVPRRAAHRDSGGAVAQRRRHLSAVATGESSCRAGSRPVELIQLKMRCENQQGGRCVTFAQPRAALTLTD